MQKAHYIVTGIDKTGKVWTMETVGEESLLSAGEYAREVNDDGDCKGARVNRWNGRSFRDVTQQAAEIVFEKWLEDRYPGDDPGDWLCDNCPPAADIRERQEARQYHANKWIDERYDLSREAR